MADVIKGLIGKEDFTLQTNTGAAEQFERKDLIRRIPMEGSEILNPTESTPPGGPSNIDELRNRYKY